jgi:uncharacterized membrane protein
MEHNIGVGAIVGLVTASSIYIYNSNKFNSVQKTILLICILFPPAQWIGILIVLAYNNYIENNSVEKVNQRKTEQKTNNLNSQVESLKDLKEKGILSEEEYKSKVEKIEAEKAKQDLKNSTEYKQLKDLFDLGVLTKDEFENKVNKLKNIEVKSINEEDVLKINSEINKTYIQNYNIEKVEETSNKSQKTESSTRIYIFSILFFILLISGTLFLSDHNSKDTNVDSNYYEQPIVDTISAYQNNYRETMKIKKFVYVVLKIEKPNLDVYEPKGYINSFGNYETFDPTYSIEYEKETYTTDIIEISDYNIDEKYKVIDDAKNKIDFQLKLHDDVFSSNLWVKCKDDRKREEFKKIRSKITDSQVFEFDSYSEASIHKQNNSE